MKNHKTVLRGLIITGLLLTACLSAQIPFGIPSASVPSLPSISVPTLGIPTVIVPTLNAPAIGLTAVNGILSTPRPTGTQIPAVPVTGGTADEAIQWLIYGLLALVGIAVVIAMFARFLKRTEGPDEPNKLDE